MAEGTWGQEEVTADSPPSVEWRLFEESCADRQNCVVTAPAVGGFTSSPRLGGGPNRTISYIGNQKPCIPCTTTVRFRNADLVVSSFEKRDSEYDVVPLLLIFVLLHL